MMIGIRRTKEDGSKNKRGERELHVLLFGPREMRCKMRFEMRFDLSTTRNYDPIANNNNNKK